LHDDDVDASGRTRGGLAGTLAAAAVVDFVDQVTIVERDSCPTNRQTARAFHKPGTRIC